MSSKYGWNRDPSQFPDRMGMSQIFATRHAIARPDYDDNVEFMKFSERNRVLFVGAENCAIISDTASLTWPGHISLYNTSKIGPEFVGRQVQAYITTNKATLGCIVWHPLDGKLLIKDGQFLHFFHLWPSK
jgi:hypothetical protein